MNNSIATRFGQHLSRQTRRLKQMLHLRVHHRYPDFSILLPAEHLLPIYQQQHLRYDRFLPHLVAALGSDATIIDVGANCGDTLAGMLERNPRATYVCIEPDPQFFGLLQGNIARIQSSIGRLAVHTVQSLIGKRVGAVTLAGGGGSRHAVVASGADAGHFSATLDSILAELPPLAVKLLKSDVDGFDFDVIDSAEYLLNTQQPILFFETQCDVLEQLAGFKRTIAWLETLGYDHWTAFDNFGAVVVRATNAQMITQLLDYVWQQTQQQASRTIYYLDVLACTSADVTLIDGVLDSY